MWTLLCSGSAVQRNFVKRTWGAAGLCVLFSVVAALLLRQGHLRGLMSYLIAVLPALPIVAGLIWTAVYLEEEKDEFQRNLLIQMLLAGIGMTLAITTAWGYLEDFLNVAHLNPIWIYPMFWLFSGASYPLVRLRYR